MSLKRYALITAICFLFAGSLAADDIPVRIEVHGVKPSGGFVYVSVYAGADAWKKKEAAHRLRLEASGDMVSTDLNLPEGEYVLNTFQDTNGSEKLEANLFHMPKEPAGISNYNGKGMPGNFDKLKVIVHKGAAKIILQLYKV
jgi:uncharacterized protein (DUF2141 family)